MRRRVSDGTGGARNEQKPPLRPALRLVFGVPHPDPTDNVTFSVWGRAIDKVDQHFETNRVSLRIIP
jgi:hypothetical protein